MPDEWNCYEAVPNADSLYNIRFAGSFKQTEARSMLDMINSMRTNYETAWYYAADGSKLYLSDLEPLQYDYELEKMAMKRAEEIALSFSHTRPNGTSCFTVRTLTRQSVNGALHSTRPASRPICWSAASTHCV